MSMLTILFAPMDGVGHVNACIGLAEVLRSRGHRIIFVVDNAYEGQLVKYGFHEELLISAKKGKPGEAGADHLLKEGMLSGVSPKEKLKIMVESNFLSHVVDQTIAREPLMKRILEKHKPDVIIIDHFVGSAALMYSGIPWVFLFSGNPLFVIQDERTPPECSGFPTNGDKNSKEWKEFRELNKSRFERHRDKYNKWLKENGFLTIKSLQLIPESPYLNLYGYPEELDYTDIRPLPEKWCRIDAFMRKTEQEFEFPEKLKDRDESKEKLIYLSMGSMGCANIDLMKRLIKILSKSPNKFIVSKGLFGDQYELADNMWGKNSVPQTKVLPLVDLVITHGGNNTITETFSFGKPMVVLPLFADQFDNAQRVEEKGFGIRLEPNTCSEEDLLEGIQKLLNDKELEKRLSEASKRMANSESIVKASKLIENLVKN